MDGREIDEVHPLIIRIGFGIGWAYLGLAIFMASWLLQTLIA